MRWCAGVAVAVTLGALRAVNGQDIRITGVTWAQSIDLRPLRRDSVPTSAATGTGETRRGPQGQLVNCVEGDTYCVFLTSRERETTRPLLQDLSIAVWGLGQGISLHAHGRAREALGASAASWPRLNDRFDVLDAYLELDRRRARVRLGRQWTLGGLGAYSFDGGAVTARGSWVDADIYGGRALVQGLSESYTSAEIGAVDELPPDTPAWLIGGRVRARPGQSAAVTLHYVRLVQDDRSGLYAERFAADASLRAVGVRFTANYAVDLASATINEARVRATRGVGRSADLSFEARRHRPFFELWTIWGAFAPIGFDEGRATLGWRSGEGQLGLSASGAYRRYEEAGTGLVSAPLRNSGWRAAADAVWSPAAQLSASASYAVDIGFGSSQSNGSAGVVWHAADRVELGATASALQTIYEFRVGTGRVLGASLNGTWRISTDTRFRLDAGAYRHALTNDAPGQDWSQRRLSARLEWALGADPGNGR